MIRLTGVPVLIMLLIAGGSYGNAGVSSVSTLMNTAPATTSDIDTLRAQIAIVEQQNKALQQERDQNQKLLTSLEQQYQGSTVEQLHEGLQQAFVQLTTHAEQLWMTLLSPDRLFLFQQLAESPLLPTPEGLREALAELTSLVQMTGTVGTVSMPVVQGDGSQLVQDVMFAGPFTISSNDNFLIYEPESSRLITAARQPSMITRLYGASLSSSDRTALAIDPLHGGLVKSLPLPSQPSGRTAMMDDRSLLWIVLAIMGAGLVLAVLYGLGLRRDMRKLEDLYWHLLTLQKESFRPERVPAAGERTAEMDAQHEQANEKRRASA